MPIFMDCDTFYSWAGPKHETFSTFTLDRFNHSEANLKNNDFVLCYSNLQRRVKYLFKLISHLKFLGL